MKRRVWTGMAITAMLVLGSRNLAQASPVNKVEANDTFSTAQNVDAFFSLDYSDDIGDSAGFDTSTTIPHVTVNAFGDFASNGTLDWYSFYVSAPGVTGIFDIDYGMFDFDANLELKDSAGATLAFDDDYSTVAGRGGSAHGFDSFIQYVFGAAGYYEIGVGRCCFMGNPPAGADYALQISIGDHPLAEVPEPATLTMLGTGILGVVRHVRRRRAAR